MPFAEAEHAQRQSLRGPASRQPARPVGQPARLPRGGLRRWGLRLESESSPPAAAPPPPPPLAIQWRAAAGRRVAGTTSLPHTRRRVRGPRHGQTCRALKPPRRIVQWLLTRGGFGPRPGNAELLGAISAAAPLRPLLACAGPFTPAAGRVGCLLHCACRPFGLVSLTRGWVGGSGWVAGA